MTTYSGPHQVMISGGRGILSEEDFRSYFDFIMEAFAIHIDRERIRHGLWKEYPAADQANQIKIKIDRVVRSLERISSLRIDGSREGHVPEQIRALENNIKEELYDIINYAIFTGRQL